MSNNTASVFEKISFITDNLTTNNQIMFEVVNGFIAHLKGEDFKLNGNSPSEGLTDELDAALEELLPDGDSYMQCSDLLSDLIMEVESKSYDAGFRAAVTLIKTLFSLAST